LSSIQDDRIKMIVSTKTATTNAAANTHCKTKVPASALAINSGAIVAGPMQYIRNFRHDL
jgi:hypothetical protein